MSQDAKKFIMGLLQPIPSKRMKPLEALRHPWIVKNTSDCALDVRLIDTLRGCQQNLNHLQRHILEVLTSLLSAKDTINIRNAFSAFDEDYSGTLNFKEFKSVFEKYSLDMDNDEI